MRLFSLLFPLFLLATFSGFSKPIKTQLANQSAEDLLQKLSEKINILNTVSYQYKRESVYSSENYYGKIEAAIYVDFTDKDTALGFKYQIDNEAALDIYNGSEQFTLNKKAKTIDTKVQPQKSAFKNYSFFYNSIITLRNFLPIIIANKDLYKTVADTMIDNKSFFVTPIFFTKNNIDPYFGFIDTTTLKGIAFIYKIIIDKETFLPTQVILGNSKSADYTRTIFTFTNAQMPTESSWYYTSYTDNYKPAISEESPKLLAVGETAPNFALPLYNSSKSVQLSHLKDKVVLLDFWIKNCSPCIESVPHINALKEKYKGKNVEIVSINPYDTKQEVEWFCNKHKTTYPVVLNGKDVAEKYGVSAFPAFFIVDKNGKILYSQSGFNEQKIEAILQANL